MLHFRTMQNRESMRPPVRLLAVIAAAAVLAARPAALHAATYFVDGACPTSGSGGAIGCGASGPFKTVSEGISALQPGDTLNIRGAHDGFDGMYKEYVGIWGTAGDGAPGKALSCTAASPCVVQGCPAAACGADETPTITGLVRRTDWTDRGGGVYSRTMESRSEYIGDDSPGSSTNPVQILQGDDIAALTQLQYAGNNVAAPGDGQWSFEPSTNRVFVNPAGTGHPNAALRLWVPDQLGLLTMQGDVNRCPSSPACPESSHVTVRRLTFAGSRWMGLLLWPASPPNYQSGINLDRVTVRYIPRFAINPYRHQNFTWTDLLIEKGARGVSVNPSGFGGGFALRVANSNGGGTIRNLTIRHYGQAGRFQGTSFDYGGIECHWCEAPWNDKTGNYVSSNGLGLDLKWSTGITVSGVTIEDVSWAGIRLDTVNNSTLEAFAVRGARYGVQLTEYASPPFTRLYNVVVRDGELDTVGFNDGGGIVGESISPLGAGEFAYRVHNVEISRPSYAGISIDSADRVSVWNNTIHGVHPLLGGWAPPDGIKIIGTAAHLDVRNNIVSDVTGDGIEVASGTTASAPTFDHDLVHGVAAGSCAVRWGGACYATVAALRAATTAEANGLDGDPQFADVAVLDLRVCEGTQVPVAACQGRSPAIDRAADVGLPFAGAAPDIGALEAGVQLPPPAPTLITVAPVN